MIIKHAEDKTPQVRLLKSLLERAPSEKRKAIQQDLDNLQRGIEGERKTAFYINRHMGDDEGFRPNVVLHDLRLEIDGERAQIDHLLIHRTHRFYILEGKNWTNGVMINAQKEFHYWDTAKKTWRGAPSPLEQAILQSRVLAKVLSKQLKIKQPLIDCIVLIAPESKIERPDGVAINEVVKADQFFSAYGEKHMATFKTFSDYARAIKCMTLGKTPESIGKELLALNKPMQFDYAAKHGMRFDDSPEIAQKTTLRPPYPGPERRT